MLGKGQHAVFIWVLLIPTHAKECKQPICMASEEKILYWIPKLKTLTFECSADPRIATIHRQKLMIEWTLEASGEVVQLASWKDEIKVTESAPFLAHAEVKKMENVKLPQQPKQLSWDISLINLDLERKEPECFESRLRNGLVKCKVTDGGMEIGSIKYQLKEASKPSWITIPKPKGAINGRLELNVIEGNALEVICIVMSQIQPHIEWIINKQLAKIKASVINSGNNFWTSTLILPIDRTHDGANVSCTASILISNLKSESINSSKWHLHVASLPKFIKISKEGFHADGYAVEGTDVSLTCNSDCIGRCSYTWKRRNFGNDIFSSERILKFRASKESNGIYWCEVHGEAGYLSSSQERVVVFSLPSIPEFKLNDSSSLVCTSKDMGTPPAMIKWKDGENVISYGSVFELQSKLEKPSLIKLTCIVENLVGFQTASLLVALPAKASPSTTIPKMSYQQKQFANIINNMSCSFESQTKLAMEQIRCVLQTMEGNETIFISISNEDKNEPKYSSQEIKINPEVVTKLEQIKESTNIDKKKLMKNVTKIYQKQEPLRTNDSEKLQKDSIRPLLGEVKDISEQLPQDEEKRDIITASIVIVGLFVCALLIAAAMRCTMGSEKSVIVDMEEKGTENDIDEYENNRITMEINNVLNQDFDIRSQVSSIGSLSHNAGSDTLPIITIHQNIEEEAEDTIKNLSTIDVTVTDSGKCVDGEEIRRTNVELKESCELIGGYVQDLTTFFNIIDDLTRVIHDTDTNDSAVEEAIENARELVQNENQISKQMDEENILL